MKKPNPKRNVAGNNQIRKEKAQKKKDTKYTKRRVARGRGKLSAAAADAVAKRPGDAHAQIKLILRDSHVPAAFGRERGISDPTHTNYRRVLQRGLNTLKSCRYPVQNIEDVRRLHVIKLVERWERDGLSDKTVNSYVSTWRRFSELIGKVGMIPEGLEWYALLHRHGIQVGTRGCSLIPKFPKGWRDCGVDPLPLIAKIEQEDPVVGCQLLLQLYFGLRMNESCQIVPSDSDKSDHIMVWRGTKGKKERRIEFSNDPAKRAAQREALDRAKELASQHRQRCLAHPGRKLHSMKNHMSYLVRKHGISRDGLGVTMHGLRHQFACDLFRELTGLPAPVLGEIDPKEFGAREAVLRAAILEVAQQMGHERGEIVYAYIGSPSAKSKN